MEEKMYLQLFAEDPMSEPNSDGNSTKKEGVDPPSQPEPKEDEKKYTDKDVDEIINRKFADWEKRQQKKVDEAAKLAEMNATEQAEYRAKQLEEELAEYKRRDTMSGMLKTARSMLAGEGVTIPDDLVSMIISEDAEKTKSCVEGFAKAFKEAVNSAVKDALRGNPPKAPSGGKVLTKDEILDVKDRDERLKLIKENPHLFVRQK